MTSSATTTVGNSPATGVPTITGTAQVGETLTADVSGIADADGLTSVAYSYQWISNDGTSDTHIAGATSSTYTLMTTDVGKTIKVEVNFTDDAGFNETLTSTATDEVSFAVGKQGVENSPATGAPTITGTPQVGETLTADTSGIDDADGLRGATFSYQWISNGSSGMMTTATTNPTYTLGAFDNGHTIKVKVSFTDDAGNDEALTSAATSSVAARPNSEATGAPTISGTAQVGETLTADTSGIADSDGLSSVSYSYQWVSNDGTSDTEIPNATDSTYTLVAADEGKTIKVKVTFTDDAGFNETLTSTATEEVSFAVQQQIANSPATGGPAITGTAQVGETLTADTSGISDFDGLTNVSYSYQWISNDGTSDTDITGATGSSYTLVADDEGNTIKVKVSFTDDEDNDETLTSAATASVLSAGEGVSGQSGSEEVSYITVAVTENTSDPNNVVTNFTVTWNDADECSTNYNAYLNIRPGNKPGHETPGSQHHLGSAATDSSPITKGLTGVQGPVEGFTVEVYCGTDGSGQMVSRVDVTWSDGRPRPGTYSSEPPLSVLSVSYGTLTPAFNSYTSEYTVPDVANDVTRLTIAATAKEGYAVDLFETSGDGVFAFGVYSFGPWGPPSGLSADCSRGYSDRNGPLIKLTDADPNTAGFQVDLYDGGNHVHVRVYPTAYCDLGTGYNLAITRAEGSVFLVRPNRPAVGLPHIGPAYTRGPCVGCTMEADVSYISDRDGWDTTTFSYQWLADDAEINFATGSSYTVTDAVLGKTLKVRVTFTDDRGTEETVNSNATKVVKLPNVEPTGKPAILGTLEVGQTLTADVSGISDPNGMTDSTFSYEWANFHGPVRDGEEYTLVDRDEGDCGCWLIVTYTDDAGHEERIHGEPIGVVAPRSNSPATGTPAITGTAQVGETLTADTSGIADADGLANVSYSYQWVSNDGTSDTEIPNATDSTYTLVASDEGNTIKVEVSFTDDAGFEETLTSTATASVVSASEGASGQGSTQNSPATGAPTISGTAQVGETLTADTSGITDSDGLTSVSYSYQWISNDGTSDTEITGATDSTYTLVAADEGKTIKVKVTFTDDADNDESLTSDATATVTARPNSPATGTLDIAGMAQVGGTLTADTTGIADSDGLTHVSYSYQWIRNDGTSDADITGATDSTYTLVSADEGSTVKVRVSFTDDADNDETLTSAATTSVAATPSPLTVSLANNPASHNGTDVFTFQIRFSEETRLSFRTLRDQAFTVTGGTVKKAKRQVKGSNMGWTITVEPDSNAAVEIVLPTTTDCATTGAICTGEGRKLSNRLEFRVSGPNQ